MRVPQRACGELGNTQGNHSDHSHSHPDALKKGYALSSANRQYHKATKPAAQTSRKPAASSSSTGSTVAEADLRIAKANIADLHDQIAKLAEVRDALHLKLYKATCLANAKLGDACGQFMFCGRVLTIRRR